MTTNESAPAPELAAFVGVPVSLSSPQKDESATEDYTLIDDDERLKFLQERAAHREKYMQYERTAKISIVGIVLVWLLLAFVWAPQVFNWGSPEAIKLANVPSATVTGVIAGNSVRGENDWVPLHEGTTSSETVDRFYMGPGSTRVRDHRGLQQLKTKNQVVFVFFYATWCVWCQRAAPTWKALTSAAPSGVVMAHVDCTTNQELCRNEKVMAFPTFRLFINGVKGPPDFKGDRSVPSFSKFLAKEAVPVLNTVNRLAMHPNKVESLTPETYIEFEEYHPSSLITFYVGDCIWWERFVPTWERLASDPRMRYPMAQVDCEVHDQFCKEHRIRAFPTIRFNKNRYEHKDYVQDRTVEALLQFMAEYMGEPPAVTTPDEWVKTERSNDDDDMVGIDFDEDKEAFSEDEDEDGDEAAGFEIDPSVEGDAQRSIHSDEEMPASASTDDWLEDDKAESTAQTLSKPIQRTTKWHDLDVEYAARVKDYQSVLGGSENVIIAFSHSSEESCPQCGSIRRDWHSYARDVHQAGMKNLLVAEIDCADNLCPSVPMPSYRWYHRGSQVGDSTLIRSDSDLMGFTKMMLEMEHLHEEE